MRQLIYSVLKTGSSTLASLLSALFLTKIIAIIAGPTGIGLFSLLRQLVSTISITGAGGQSSLVLGVSSKTGDDRDLFIRTSFWLFFWGMAFTVFLLEFFRFRNFPN